MPVTSLSDIRSNVSAIIRAASGVERLILADQGEAPPKGLYGTYKIYPIRAYGHPRSSRTLIPELEPGPEDDWQDMQETVISQMLIMVSFNFINEGAEDAAWKMHNANFRPAISNMLFSNGIGWRGVGQVRNLSGVDRAYPQDRYQMDLTLVIETEISDNILRAAGFSLAIEDDQGNPLNNGES